MTHNRFSGFIYYNIEIHHIIDILNLFKSVCSEKSTIKFLSAGKYDFPRYSKQKEKKYVTIKILSDSPTELEMFDNNIIHIIDGHDGQFDAMIYANKE